MTYQFLNILSDLLNMSVKIYFNLFCCMKHVVSNIYVCCTKNFRKDVFDLLGFCAASLGSLLVTFQACVSVPLSRVKMLQKMCMLKLNVPVCRYIYATLCQ